MKLCKLLLLFLPLSSSVFPQDTSYLKFYYVGDNLIPIERSRFKPTNSKVLFLNMHDNENTSIEAAGYLLCEKGGSLVRIENCEERFIAFSFDGYDFLFDPNRIFSRAGITSTLTLLSACYDPLAANQVAGFAHQVVKNYITGSKLIIALHNNRDKELSVISYQKDQAAQKHTGRVYINPKMDADDFMLTTNLRLFNRIKKKNINVIWENVDSIKDDGSLSVYAGQHNIAYINVEAEHGHGTEQAAMIAALSDIIQEYSLNTRSSYRRKTTYTTPRSRKQH